MCKISVKASKLCNASIFPPAFSTFSDQIGKLLLATVRLSLSGMWLGIYNLRGLLSLPKGSTHAAITNIRIISGFIYGGPCSLWSLTTFPSPHHSTSLSLSALHSHTSSSSSSTQCFAFWCFVRNPRFLDIFPSCFFTVKSPMNPLGPSLHAILLENPM